MNSEQNDDSISRLYRLAKQTRHPEPPTSDIPRPRVSADADEMQHSEAGVEGLYRRYKRQRRAHTSLSEQATETVAKKPLSPVMKIVIPMLLGALVGLWFHTLPDSFDGIKTTLVDNVLQSIGSIFVGLFKMMVVPVVFVSLVSSVASFSSLRDLSRIGIKSTLLYVLSTTIAVSIGLSMAAWFDPGQGYQPQYQSFEYSQEDIPSSNLILSTLTPINIFKAMAEGHVIGVIIFALLFAASLRYSGKDGKHVLNFFQDLNSVIQNMLLLIMKLAPLGSFALLAVVFASEGMDLVRPLLGYMFVLMGSLILHATLTYSVMLRLLGSLNPLSFIRKMPIVNLFAFTTASSNATIPLSMRNARDSMGVSESMCSLTIPFGATMNMDGTAIMQGVASVFIANVYGVDLEMNHYLAIVIGTVFASVGTAGVPGVGLAMLAIVLQQAGLPVEGIGLIIGVDRLLDMMRTAINVTGDAAVTCVVARSEQAIDENVYRDPKAKLTSLAPASEVRSF